jgi:hypothetical protein
MKPRLSYLSEHNEWVCSEPSQPFSFATGSSMELAYKAWIYNLQLLLEMQQRATDRAERRASEYISLVKRYQVWLDEARKPWWKRLFPFSFK